MAGLPGHRSEPALRRRRPGGRAVLILSPVTSLISPHTSLLHTSSLLLSLLHASSLFCLCNTPHLSCSFSTTCLISLDLSLQHASSFLFLFRYTPHLSCVVSATCLTSPVASQLHASPFLLPPSYTSHLSCYLYSNLTDYLLRYSWRGSYYEGSKQHLVFHHSVLTNSMQPTTLHL